MKGSLTIDLAFQLDVESRLLMTEIISENLEAMKKAGISTF